MIMARELPVFRALPRVLKNEFANFAAYMFAIQGMKITEMQKSICRYIQPNRPVKGTKDKIVLSYRSVGKTEILRFLALWYLSVWPHERVMFIGSNASKGEKIGEALRNMIEKIPLFEPIRPERNGTDQAFNVKGHRLGDSHKSFEIYGVSGTPTGNRAGLIILDDCEVAKSADFVAASTHLRNLFNELYAIQAVEEPHHAKIVFGTPHSTDSVYTSVANTHDLVLRIWPAAYPDLTKCDSRYIQSLDPALLAKVKRNPALVGNPTDRMDPDHLRRKPGYPDGLNFRMHYMLDTYVRDSDTFPLRCADLIVYNFGKKVPTELIWSNDKEQKSGFRCPGKAGDAFYNPRPIPKELPFTEMDKVIAYVDPASSGIDEMAIAIAGHAAGKIWVYEVQGFGSDEHATRLQSIAELIKRYEVNKVIVESNHSGAFVDLIKGKLHGVGYRCTVDGKHVHTNKQKRIYGTLSDMFTQHRIVIHESMVNRNARSSRYPGKNLFHQIANFNSFASTLKHDDRLDALTGACEELSEFLRVDPEKSRFETMTAEERLKALFHAQATGNMELAVAIAGPSGLLKMGAELEQQGDGVLGLSGRGLRL